MWCSLFRYPLVFILSNSQLLDAIFAVKVLARQVEELQAEIKVLKGE